MIIRVLQDRSAIIITTHVTSYMDLVEYEEVGSFQLSLDVFLKTYSARLPQVVAVDVSLYGICSDSFTKGRLLQIYFLKETKVINLKINQISHSIPLASPIKYSILYNPQKNLSAARDGYIFATVGDILKSRALPSVVCVGKEFTASSSTYLQKGHILIIKAIEVLPKNVKKLKCYCIHTGKVLTLDENCKGHFSTQPSLTCLDISTILNHFQLPVTVMFHSENASSSKWFKQEQTGVITEHYTMQSVIASFCPLDSKVDKNGCKHIVQKVPKELVEIVSTVAIDVRIVKLSDDEMVQLKLNADVLARSISPQYVTDVITSMFASINPFQKEMLMSISPEEWRNDIHNVNDTEYEILPFNDFINKVNETDGSKTTTGESESPKSPTSGVIGLSPPPVPPKTTRSKKNNPPVPEKVKRTVQRSKVYEDITSNDVSSKYAHFKTHTPPMSLKMQNNDELSLSFTENSPHHQPSSLSLPPKIPDRISRSQSVMTNNPCYNVISKKRSQFTVDNPEIAGQSELMKELEVLKKSNVHLVARIRELENTLLLISKYKCRNVINSNYVYHIILISTQLLCNDI